MRFEFATAERIVFGPGTLVEAGKLAAKLGRHPLVVTGRTVSRAQPLLDLLQGEGLGITTFAVDREPDLDTVRLGVAVAHEAGCDSVIGFGGGAALDTAKAIAAMASNEGDILDYLEIIGRGKALSKPSLPTMAIPTTAGTGSEVTRNSVITSPKHRVKVSLRSPLLMPRVALVDPELTYDLPPGLTATTGLDALAQLIEPFVSTRANPLVDGLCREGLARVARSLRLAFHQGRNPAAREDMALASLCGGLALANAGLGAVHGIAGPLGGLISAPHGALCAALLAPVVEMNLLALRTRRPDSPALPRYQELARILTGRPDATAEDATGQLRALVEELEIPRLRSYGFTPEHMPELVEKAAQASSMKANPIELTADELAAIIKSAM